MAALAVVAALLWAPLAASPAAGVSVDSHVVRFEASPSYINLGMVTLLTVEIGTSYGAGQDNYRATVTAPAGATATAWYNFTVLGTLSLQYGNASADFMVGVTQPGTFVAVLEHYDGVTFAPAGYSEFGATDVLLVTPEAASASNEYTDVHNCPVAQEFQRGGEIIARAYVRYASTGEFVNGTRVRSAVGNITGTMFGLTQVLRWHNVNHFWRWAWFVNWNTTVGVVSFTVNAADGLGNRGTAASSLTGGTAWRVIPAILKVVPKITNGTGASTVVFTAGDTISIEARVTYESHKQHNRVFPGPLNATRGGAVTVALGYGAFNATSGQYEFPLTTVTLTLNTVTQNWTGSYTVKATDPVRPDFQAYVFAQDSTTPPNTGKAFTTSFAIRATPSNPPPAPTGLDPVFAVIGAVVALAAGLGVGVAVARRRKGGKPAKKEEAKREEEEEWTVEEEGGAKP